MNKPNELISLIDRLLRLEGEKSPKWEYDELTSGYLLPLDQIGYIFLQKWNGLDKQTRSFGLAIYNAAGKSRKTYNVDSSESSVYPKLRELFRKAESDAQSGESILAPIEKYLDQLGV